MTFFISHSRFTFTDERRNEVNAFRGALGAHLHKRDSLYGKWFDPYWREGPSGYRNAPRPFVLRHTRESEAALDLIVFKSNYERAELEDAFRQAVASVPGVSGVALQSTTHFELPVEAPHKNGTLRIEFVTPTALRQGGTMAHEPEFAVIVGRLAERVRALGRLYQGWPASSNFKALLACAARVKLRTYRWRHDESENRRSARSGAVHDLRGFTGWAEYSGPVGQFLPLLEIGSWTGVGRHTVWGNGAIRVACFAEESAA